MRRPIIVVCLSAASLWAVGACSGSLPADATGEQIYRGMCASCHGEDLEGSVGPAIGPGSNAAEQDDDFLVLTITRGRGRMPSFESTLTKDQIARVVDYVRVRQQLEESG